MRLRGDKPPVWSIAEKQILWNFFEAEGAMGCMERMPSLALRGAPAIKQMARKLALTNPNLPAWTIKTFDDDQIEEIIRLRDDEKLSFARIAQRFGTAETTCSNAYYIAMCPRKGHRPAARDEHGRLAPAETERLRALLRAGAKPVDIQLHMAISAGCIAAERRQYNAELRARGKRALPPPGGGARYSGARIPAATRREIEDLYLQGLATPKISARTGVSKTHCLRTRHRLIRRLKREGRCLPGCDQEGKRLRYDTLLRIPPERKAALRRLLLDRVPVRRAAFETGIGGCSAYRIRDELKAELEARGETLPDPILPGSTPVANRRWLPPQRRYWVYYRQLETRYGHDAARAYIERGLRAIVELPRECRRAVENARRSRPLTFEEQLARVRAGAGLVAAFKPSRPAPDITLGGVASAML